MTARDPASPPPADPGAPAAARSAESDEARAARGVSWAMVGFIAAQVLRFGGNLVITRLVAPEALGIMAVINATLMGLTMLSDVGIGPSIIMNPRGDERAFQHTAWTIQVVRGAILLAAASVAALPMTWVYREDALLWWIPLAATSALLSGFNSIQMFVQHRHLRYKAVTLIELATQVIGLVVMIAWAVASPTVVALIAGTVASALGRMLMSRALLSGSGGSFHWDKDAARHILGTGKWIFLSTALAFLSAQLDRFLFGALYDFALLGVYHIAMQVAGMPSAALSQLGNVLFPYLSRKAGDLDALRAAYHEARRPLVLVGGWAISGLIACGPAMIAVLYPSTYAKAGPILQLSAVGMWFGVVLESPTGAVLLAQGKPRWTAAGSAAKLIGMATLLPAGSVLAKHVSDDGDASFYGALLGLVLAEVLRYATTLGAAVRGGLARPLQDARITLGLAAMAALALVANEGLRALGLASLFAGLGLSDAWSGRLAALLTASLLGAFVTAAWAPWLWPLVRARRLFKPGGA